MANDLIENRVALEAARLRYDNPEEFREYYQAKREAAKRFNVDILPSNKLIYQYYQDIADTKEGKEQRQQRLRKMREEALEWLEDFEKYGFDCWVIGSVQRGDVTLKSDIDIQVFAEEDPTDFLEALDENGVEYDHEIKTVKKDGERKDYFHVYLKKEFDCEVSVYVKGKHEPQTCSIFGVKIIGWKRKQLLKELKGEGNNS